MRRISATIQALAISAVVVTVVLAGCAGPNPTFDGGPDFEIYEDTLTCLPDNDGVIQQGELTFKTGLIANYRVNPANTIATVDTKGQLVDGKIEWDFSRVGGNVVSLESESIAGTWFAKYFPDGDFAWVVQAARGDTLQVLKVEPGRVLLMGIVSRKAEHTLMIYDPPVVAMKFPLQKGTRFTVSSKLKEGSKFEGLPYYSEDTYEVSIELEGVLRLPNLKLHRTLLIETLLTSKTMGGVVATTRQLQWFSECYGEVVRALSTLNEEERFFSRAKEFRRLSF
jgi:hypothetical protein